jgi:hypothetical protein
MHQPEGRVHIDAPNWPKKNKNKNVKVFKRLIVTPSFLTDEGINDEIRRVITTQTMLCRENQRFVPPNLVHALNPGPRRAPPHTATHIFEYDPDLTNHVVATTALPNRHWTDMTARELPFCMDLVDVRSDVRMRSTRWFTEEVIRRALLDMRNLKDDDNGRLSSNASTWIDEFKNKTTFEVLGAKNKPDTIDLYTIDPKEGEFPVRVVTKFYSKVKEYDSAKKDDASTLTSLSFPEGNYGYLAEDKTLKLPEMHTAIRVPEKLTSKFENLQRFNTPSTVPSLYADMIRKAQDTMNPIPIRRQLRDMLRD